MYVSLYELVKQAFIYIPTGCLKEAFLYTRWMSKNNLLTIQVTKQSKTICKSAVSRITNSKIMNY